MLQANRIIVGVMMPENRPWDAANLAAPSRLAVRQAFEVAAALNSPVELVCVLPEVATGFFSSEEAAAAEAESEKTEALGVLNDLRNQYAGSSRVQSKAIVAFGRPWLEIMKVAGPSADNLIVCGTKEQGAVSRLLFGSTGLKLLRNAPGAVWLVKPRVDDDADLDVLAATDLSEIGEDVLHAGVTLGRALPVRLNVLNVVDDDLDRHMARTGVSEDELCKYRESLLAEAETKVHEQLAGTDYRTVEKSVQVHIAEGPAHACILSAIENLDIDLLVMATHGRGGIPGMLFGNTAERLLPELPCALLALKPDDFACPVSFEEAD